MSLKETIPVYTLKGNYKSNFKSIKQRVIQLLRKTVSIPISLSFIAVLY
jgi:hypothetical protein